MPQGEPSRDQELRRQAEAVAERRTNERDQLRVSMPTGLAVEALIAQVKRLRRTPCPTMGFDCDAEPVAQVDALVNEITELLRERVGSEGWNSEVLDVITVALNLAIASGIRLDAALAAQAAKLGRRLNHIDHGGTWAEAKALEASPTQGS